jgi:hypothetical protein
VTLLPTSAGTVAYDSHGSGDPIALLPSGGHEHHPHTTSPAAVAAELASLGNTAFDAGSRTNDTQYSRPATKEQE